MKIFPVEVELFHGDGETDRHTGMTKLITLRTRLKGEDHYIYIDVCFHKGNKCGKRTCRYFIEDNT